jgi:hypothetical protein
VRPDRSHDDGYKSAYARHDSPSVLVALHELPAFRDVCL